MTTTQAERLGVTLEVLEGPESAVDDDGWWHYAYKVKLHRGRRGLIIPWHQGEALLDEPTAGDVLEALLADAATHENAPGFEDWAAELGFDPDSRKAERIWKQSLRQTDNLREFLGADFRSAVFPDEQDADAKSRLEYLRGQLRAECLSWAEVAELQSLAEHIEPGDVELLEAAGVPEFEDSDE